MLQDISCCAFIHRNNPSSVNSLRNKFGWANILASQKDISFSIQEDFIAATEFSPTEVVRLKGSYYSQQFYDLDYSL
jgi:hypothetical protein